MADYNESSNLQFEDDFCKIFNTVSKQQLNDVNLNQLGTLNTRNVKYLQISLKSLNLNSKQFQDKSIKLNVKLPMIRNNTIEYQIHQTYDIGKNGKSLMFNAQFRSNFQLTENSLGQINQAVIYFQVFSLDVEIGKAEFLLSTMILDGLRCFTYQIPIQQLAQVQNKNNKKGKVDKLIETGQLEFEIQLQDIDARSQQIEQSPKKEIDIEEQVQKIYEKVTEQNQKEKDKKRQFKQQQEEEMNQQLISQLQSFQLYLNIGKLIHLNQVLCQEKIEDEQINLYLKFKSYGTQEINQTPTNWNTSKWFINYNVRCPITITSLNKMENFPWILELWAKHTQTNQDILVGIARLSLTAISALILNSNPLVVIQTLRSNLSPQILFDEDIPFEDLRTKQTMAIIKLKLAFGTNPQINKLLNSEITYVDESIDEEPEEAPIDNINEPEKQPEPPQIEQPLVYEKIPLQECLITTLNKISQTIRILPKEQFILIDEFIDIVLQLCGLNFNKRMITSLSQYLQFDQSTLDWHIFLQSWQAFTNYKKQLKLNYTKIYANFYQQALKIFPSINAFERDLPHGAFGLVHRQQLKEYLLSCKGGNIPSGPSFSAITINSVFETLEVNSDDQIQISDLVDYLRQFEVQGEISKIYAPIFQLAQIIEKNMQIWIRNNKQQMDDYINNREFQQELRAQNIMEIFQELGLNCTLLDAVAIMNQIGDYNNVENQDGQKVCTEIAFWKYIDWLYQNEIEVKEPSSPIAVPQPKVNGIKKPQPIDFQFLETQFIIDFIQLTYIDGEKYQLQIQLENTGLSVTTPKTSILKSTFYENGQIPLNMRAICTLSDKFSHDFRKTLHDRMEFSGLSIVLFKDNHVFRGSLASEEILTIENEKETFFVQLFDEVKGMDATLIEFKMSIKQQVKDEKPKEGFQLFNAEGQIQQEAQITQEEILNILKPEIMHTFRINIKQINWYKNLKFNSLKVKLSLATDKKILKEAIPCFTSDDFNDDFDIVVEYQVKCDQVLATQLSKCHLQIQLLLNCNSQNKSLIGYLPIKPLFEESKVTGEIPLDDSVTGAFICTLNLDTVYTTDQIVEQIVKVEEKLKFQKKIIIRIMELILLDYKNELGEIYFMLVDPLNMSESYEVRPNTPSILNTQDCIFILSDSELQSDVVELQVRSVMLGEDKIIGNVSIQLKQLNNEGIFGESNYLRVDTKVSSLEIAARVGVKVIYICAKETSNDNYLNAFKYPAIKELENQQNIEQYLRNKLQFSFSEINFLMSLIKNDIFSTSILKPLELQAEQSIIIDLLKEFTFYDSDQLRYVNPNILVTIFGYFNLPDHRDQFIQQIHKRMPNDFQCPSNQFDYLTFLAHLQKCIPNVTPLFKIDMQGPIQHEVQQVIKKSPIKQNEETIPKLNYKQMHFHFECGRNLNALTKRIPNSILKFPQLDQESKVFHCQANPQYDALISVDVQKLKNLQVQIFDKKYSVDEKEFYKYNLIGQATIYFDQINQQFPQVIQLQLENQEHSFNQTNTIPYLNIKIWTDNEEIVPQIVKKSPTKPVVQTSKETVRRLVFDIENNENDSGKDNATIKNLEKELEEYLKSLKKKREEQPDTTTQKNEDQKSKEQPKQQQQDSDGNSNQGKKQQPKKIEKMKPQAYSSSGSSSHQNPPKSSSSGNRLEKIDEKLPINGAELKRIEKILRLNNLPIDKYDSLQDDSDYE
ncbi:unnamed protein product [Paramecium pentaurelia]|uniref:C2 domain-containing protein n=1 Tax=Paramecium pentaurelia TaxID=43138 RepID=A0A8S1XHF4_9CILI|nr:unnamed protein product [Paramecium pentaurelia]